MNTAFSAHFDQQYQLHLKPDRQECGAHRKRGALPVAAPATRAAQGLPAIPQLWLPASEQHAPDCAAADRAESGSRARPDLDEAPAAVSVRLLRRAHAHRAKTDPGA